MPVVLHAAQVFDGSALLADYAVVIEGRVVAAVIPARDIPADAPRIALDGVLAPGFIDIQVNGGGGVNLNEEPTIDGVLAIARAHRRFGTTGLLPTVITDTPEIQHSAAVAVQAARRIDPAILGIHVEGPFIDTNRKGAHDPKLIRAMTGDDIAWLSHLACGEVVLTVAPNKVALENISRLAQSGVHICLGHAQATYAEATAALKAGAKGFTHLYNAMSTISAREPGMIGAALSSDAYAGLIADGFHVNEALLRLAITAKPGKIMLVTDAMCTAAGGPDHFKLQGRDVRVRDGRLELPDGTLAGSNLTMDEAVRFCVQRLGLTLERVLPMASTAPANFLGLGDRLGQIKPGYLASLVHLDHNLQVQRTWVEGT